MGEALRNMYTVAPKIEQPKNNTKKEIYPEVDALIAENPKLQEAVKLILEECDKYTAGHVFRTANISLTLSEYLGLDEKNQKIFLQAALLHDIGKTEDEINELIKKEGKPSEEEFEIIKKHVRGSVEYAKEIGMPVEVLQIIGAHHEENNGQSYPRNEKNRTLHDETLPERRSGPDEEIKKIIHAFAIIDAFDALSSERSYKKEFSDQDCKEKLVDKFHSEEDARIIDLLFYEK